LGGGEFVAEAGDGAAAAGCGGGVEAKHDAGRARRCSCAQRKACPSISGAVPLRQVKM
jgi:hypothetical protein